MGLNLSHIDVKWSYSSFNNFREKLAREIGVKLYEMKEFGGEIPWENVKDDIVPLLNHSDCEGHLTPEECRKVAPRLRELVATWENDIDKGRALSLAEGMEKAAAANENLEFL